MSPAAKSLSRSHLASLKYRDLQRLAKEAGVKANLPKAQLVEALATESPASPAPTGRQSGRFVEFAGDIAEDSPPSSGTPKASTPQQAKVSTPAKRVSTPRGTPRPASAVKSAQKTPSNAKTVNPAASAKKIPAKTPATGSAPRRPPKSSLRGAGASARDSTLRARFAGTPGSVQKTKRFAKTPHTNKSSSKKPAAVPRVPKTPGEDPAAAARKPNGTMIPKFVSKRPPNFAKLHAQQFDKMDSLDVYLSKKLERTQSIKKTVAHCRRVAEETRADMNRAVAAIKGQPGSARRVSPRLQQQQKQRLQAHKSPAKAFVPSALAVDRKNFNFGGRKSEGKTQQPFAFTASPRVLGNITNTTAAQGQGEQAGTPGKKFDLKASLAKRLPYKPHKGKLRDFEEEKRKERMAAASKRPPTAAASAAGPSKAAAGTRVNQIKGVRLNKRAELLLQKRNMMA